MLDDCIHLDHYLIIMDCLKNSLTIGIAHINQLHLNLNGLNIVRYLFGFILACMASLTFAAKPTWTGPYLGAQAGYGWGTAKWYFPVDSYFTLPTGVRAFNTYPSGGLIGAQLGYLYQIQSYVLGIEAAYLTGGLNKMNTGPFTSLFPDDHFATTVDNIRTLTARLGYAYRNWLFYIKAGAAAAHINIFAISAPPGGGVTADQSHSQYGWTGGLGIEYFFNMFIPNVIWGIEYNYAGFRNRYYSTTTFGTPSTDPFILTINNVSTNTVTTHLTYKFM